MKSTYLGRSCRSYVALFQLYAADAVLEELKASLPTHSRNIDLENGRSFLPRVFKGENFTTRTFLLLSGGMAESAECGSACTALLFTLRLYLEWDLVTENGPPRGTGTRSHYH